MTVFRMTVFRMTVASCLVLVLGERQEIAYPTQCRMVFPDRPDWPGKADLRANYFLLLALRSGRKTTSAFAVSPLTPTLSPEYRGEGVIFRPRLSLCLPSRAETPP